MRVDRHTDTQTDTDWLIAILRTPIDVMQYVARLVTSSYFEKQIL